MYKIKMTLYQGNDCDVFDLCRICNTQLVPIKYPTCELVCEDCRYKVADDDEEDILIPKKCGLCGQKGNDFKIRPRNKNNVMSQKIAVCESCLETYY